jgi:hypothetical protein
MTWSKFSDRFSAECQAAGLSDAAFRLHVEAIQWLYHAEQADLLVPKSVVRRFPDDPHRNQHRVTRRLVAAGFWKDYGDCWLIVHQAEVIRESLRALEAKRRRDRLAQAARRLRQEDAEMTQV